jgi:DNA polymerase-3 subunit epsilon
MFKKKTYPDFWNHYVASFNNGLPQKIEDNKFVVLDTETTGFSVNEDRILSVGALILKNRSIRPKQAFEVFVDQTKYNAETVKIHGILKGGKKTTITELEALKKTLHLLENAVLVAHHALYDVTMLNKALKRNGLPKLRNKTLDTSRLYQRTLSRSKRNESNGHSTLDDMAKAFDISQKDRHTALGDAYITAIAFLRIIEKIKPATLNDLLKRDRLFRLW